MCSPMWKRVLPPSAVIAAILPALMLTGCRGNLRRLLERLDLQPIPVGAPRPHPVEVPGADQPVIRRPELIEIPLEEDPLAVRKRAHAPVVLASVGPFQPAAS